MKQSAHPHYRNRVRSHIRCEELWQESKDLWAEAVEFRRIIHFHRLNLQLCWPRPSTALTSSRSAILSSRWRMILLKSTASAQRSMLSCHLAIAPDAAPLQSLLRQEHGRPLAQKEVTAGVVALASQKSGDQPSSWPSRCVRICTRNAHQRGRRRSPSGEGSEYFLCSMLRAECWMLRAKSWMLNLEYYSLLATHSSPWFET